MVEFPSRRMSTNVIDATQVPRHKSKNLLSEPSALSIAVLSACMPNAKVSDGSQPPMTFDLSLSESAGSRSLHRLVRCSLHAQPCPFAAEPIPSNAQHLSHTRGR